MRPTLQPVGTDPTFLENLIFSTVRRELVSHFFGLRHPTRFLLDQTTDRNRNYGIRGGARV